MPCPAARRSRPLRHLAPRPARASVLASRVALAWGLCLTGLPAGALGQPGSGAGVDEPAPKAPGQATGKTGPALQAVQATTATTPTAAPAPAPETSVPPAPRPDTSPPKQPAAATPAATPPAASSAPAPAASGSQTIEITGTRGDDGDDDRERRESSIAKTVYGRAELDRHGDFDVTDVLKRLPGLSVENGQPRMRGLGGGYTQILINGEPAPPGFSLETLAPGDVERIEVVQGATAEHSAVAGTINIVLRVPPRTQQREWRANLGYRAVQPTGSSALQWGDRLGDWSFVLPLSLGRQANGGQDSQQRRSRSRLGEQLQSQQQGEDAQRSSQLQFTPRLVWRMAERTQWQASALWQINQGHNTGQRRTQYLAGPAGTTHADASDNRYRNDLLRLQTQFTHRWPDGRRLELRGSWQQQQRDGNSLYQAFRADGSRWLLRDSQSTQDDRSQSLAWRWRQPVGEQHTLSLGADAERRSQHQLRQVWDNGSEVRSNFTGQPVDTQVRRAVLFVQDEWALSPRWALLPGWRLERQTLRSASPGSPIDAGFTRALPVLHLNHRLDPAGQGKDQLRASLSRSLKWPELNALSSRYQVNGSYEAHLSNTPLAADRAGNPGLRPEKALGLDLAYEHHGSDGGFASLSVFARQIDGLIRQTVHLEADPAPGLVSAPRWVSRPLNLGRASSQGIALELKGHGHQVWPQQFNRRTPVLLRLALQAYRSSVDQVDGPDNRLEAQPPWVLNAGFDARLAAPGWNWGASLVLRPAYGTRQSDQQHSRRSAQRTLDAFISWRPDRALQLRLAAQNLLRPASSSAQRTDDLDGFSAESLSTRPSRRQVQLGATWRF